MASRALIVRDVKEIASGESDSGHTWRLYAIKADDASGEPVQAELRCFERLPVGEALELEVEPRRERDGRISYTLRRRRRGRRDSRVQEQLNQHQAAIASIARRVTLLEQAVRQPSLPLADG